MASWESTYRYVNMLWKILEGSSKNWLNSDDIGVTVLKTISRPKFTTSGALSKSTPEFAHWSEGLMVCMVVYIVFGEYVPRLKVGISGIMRVTGAVRVSS